jgi:hypothetical protein
MTPILNRVTSNTHFQQHLKSSLRHRHEQPRLERPPAGVGNGFRVQSVQVSLPDMVHAAAPRCHRWLRQRWRLCN